MKHVRLALGQSGVGGRFPRRRRRRRRHRRRHRRRRCRRRLRLCRHKKGIERLRIKQEAILSQRQSLFFMLAHEDYGIALTYRAIESIENYYE